MRADHIKSEKGNEIPDYYVLEYPDWVNVIAITKEEKFVFVRQYRHGIKQVLVELVSGVSEAEDASPLVSAQRELLEETGYSGGHWEQLTVISANPSTHSNLCHCYLATGVEKTAEQHLDANEELEVTTLSLEEVKKLLETDQITQSLHAAPLWKYLAMKGLV